MNEDQFSGTARSLGGRVEEAAGAALNDRDMQSDGIATQIKGAAQSLYGDAKETVRNTYDRVAPVTRESAQRVVEVTRDHSLLAILAAGAVGFALAVAFRNSGTSSRGSWAD